MCCSHLLCFFFNDTATTEIYTLSLHDALPIWSARRHPRPAPAAVAAASMAYCHACPPPRHAPLHPAPGRRGSSAPRSEEHTSELQSRQYLVCRLLLEKKQTNSTDYS